jgi:hypothetical protein
MYTEAISLHEQDEKYRYAVDVIKKAVIFSIRQDLYVSGLYRQARCALRRSRASCILIVN